MAKAREQPVFIVHKHIASRLHYDLRLELDGMLKSWTVPRGISMDPRIKRFATEGGTLPMSIAQFEANENREKIIVWDKGSLQFSGGEEAFIQGLQKGRMTFVLRGKKLHGAFSMFRFVGKRQWLLIKRQDKYATSEDLTRDVRSVVSRRILRDPKQ